MKKILFLLMLFLFGNNVFAFDIVYPKTHSISVNSSSFFFIGSSKYPIFINGEQIKLHSSGGFAHVVNLKDGMNKFEFKSKKQCEIFEITKVQQQHKTEQPLILYRTPKYFKVSSNIAPLRNTPKDYGINRISHLQQGVLLTSDGEQDEFYRVVLGEDNFAWIEKKHVSSTENYEYAELKGQEYFEDKDYVYFVFHFDKKIPYVIREQDGISLKFYNTKSKDFYELNYPIRGKILGYNGEYFGNDFILKIRKSISLSPQQPLKGLTITIDAGHGGQEFGAIGCLGDKEKDVVLKFAKYLKKVLQKQGVKVVMTRNRDKEVGLYERTAIANKNNSMIFISIHNNALPNNLNPNEYSGTSVYYYYDEAKPLAENILNSITKILGTNNDGLHQASFAVVRNTQALSVIVEVAYLINPSDNVLLTDKNFQKQTAKAIRQGIENYLLSN